MQELLCRTANWLLLACSIVVTSGSQRDKSVRLWHLATDDADMTNVLRTDDLEVLALARLRHLAV